MSADIISVPYDSGTGTYHLEWSVSSGTTYDPITINGTYQKRDNNKFISTSWADNNGIYQYRFTGGPDSNRIATVTIEVECYQAGASTYSFAKVGKTTSSIDTSLFTLNSGTAYGVDWRGATYGSASDPVNTDTVYVRDTKYNGSFDTAVQTRGMRITATPRQKIEVPYDSATGTYHTNWTVSSSAAYDPILLSGTYGKVDGDKFTATDWADNHGIWAYEFTGGPFSGNAIISATVKTYIYDSGGTVWQFCKLGTTLGGITNSVWSNGTGGSAGFVWEEGTVGSKNSPLGTNVIYVMDVKYNSHYATAAQTRQMEIIATPLPPKGTVIMIK